ncbi:hypothetical protein JCM3766R1_006174 [Sporobolomyces carnicolor]
MTRPFVPESDAHVGAAEPKDAESDEGTDFDEFDLQNGDYPPSTRPLLPTTYERGHKEVTKGSSRSRWPRRARARKGLSEHRLGTGALLQLATLFVLCLVLLLGIGTCSWVGWFMYTRHNAYAQSVFSPSLRPLPRAVESLVSPFDKSIRDLASVGSELDRRLLALNLPPSSLPSPTLAAKSHLDPNATFANRYSELPRAGPYLLALNLYDSQTVLPTLSKTLVSVSDWLGRDNVHISIFENGSRDNTTLALAHLAAALTSLGVRHTVVSDPRSTDWKRVDRIDQLAIYRNVALEPVAEGLDGRDFEDVLFVNDVFVGPTDVLELLWQRREQVADAACAIDWRRTKGFMSEWGAQSVKFYDNWVTRSIRGNMLRSRLDIFAEGRNGVEELFDPDEDAPSRDRLQHGLPVPVYSCWNGMIAMSAEPFRTTIVNPRFDTREGPMGVVPASLRPAAAPTVFRTALNAAGECAASECKTVAKDFWSRGYNRWIIVPTVRATYDEPTYSHPHLLDLVDRARDFIAYEATRTFASLPPHLSPTIDWSLPAFRAPSSVMCWKWARGWHIDLPSWRSTREAAWKK